jgi:hypothetical protein
MITSSDVHTHHNRRCRSRPAQYHMEMTISNILRDKISYGSSPDSVREGSSTVFGNAQFRTVVTHVLDDYSTFEEETCWTWGADTSYYNGFYKRCLEM